MRKIIAEVLCCVLALCALSGCGSNDFKLYYDIAEPIKTFDPQLAASDGELLVAGNIFEGLYRLNADGEPVLAAAGDCDISSDGTCYRFTLRDDARWEDGDPLTADDFLFAFERALTADTECASASSLFCVKNAENFYSGRVPFGDVGIVAENERTLAITLNESFDDFPLLLTEACCMPCNRAFFGNTKGRYGLNKASILSNGSFALQYFDEETGGITLKRNENYGGSFIPSAYAVGISVGGDGTATRLTDRRTDGGRVRYDEGPRLKNGSFNVTEYDCGVCALVFSAKLDVELRKILISAVDFEEVKRSLPETLPAAGGILPGTVGVADAFPATDYEYDRARADYSDYADENVVPALRAVCPSDPALGDVAREIIAYWQSGLGLYNIKLETADTDDKLLNRLSAGDYDIALAVFGDESGGVAGYLERFCADSPQNYLNRTDGRFDAFVDAYKTDGDDVNLRGALSALSDERVIIPVCSVREVFAMSEEFKGVKFRNYGCEIDFSLITE